MLHNKQFSVPGYGACQLVSSEVLPPFISADPELRPVWSPQRWVMPSWPDTLLAASQMRAWPFRQPHLFLSPSCASWLHLLGFSLLQNEGLTSLTLSFVCSQMTFILNLLILQNTLSLPYSKLSIFKVLHYIVNSLFIVYYCANTCSVDAVLIILWELKSIYQQTLVWTQFTVPSESIQTPSLFPHYVTLQTWSKIE